MLVNNLRRFKVTHGDLLDTVSFNDSLVLARINNTDRRNGLKDLMPLFSINQPKGAKALRSVMKGLANERNQLVGQFLRNVKAKDLNEF